MTTETKLTTPPTDCDTMGLTPGVAYDQSYLRFVGWTSESGGLTLDVPGYHEANYWDSEGRYLGPDCEGIVPVYEYAK